MASLVEPPGSPAPMDVSATDDTPTGFVPITHRSSHRRTPSDGAGDTSEDDTGSAAPVPAKFRLARSPRRAHSPGTTSSTLEQTLAYEEPALVPCQTCFRSFGTNAPYHCINRYDSNGNMMLLCGHCLGKNRSCNMVRSPFD
jgi:hypothetical protein